MTQRLPGRVMAAGLGSRRTRAICEGVLLTSSAANGKGAMRTRCREEKARPANMDTGHRLALSHRLASGHSGHPPRVLDPRLHHWLQPSEPLCEARVHRCHTYGTHGVLPSRRACVMPEMTARGVPPCALESEREANEGSHPRWLPRARADIMPRERASIEASEIFQISPTPATRDSSSASRLRPFNGIRVAMGDGSARTDR